MSVVAKTPQEIKEQIQRNSEYYVQDVNEGYRGVMISFMNRYLGGDESRYIVLAWLFDKEEPVSTKSLGVNQWFALHGWIQPHTEDSTGHWIPNPTFEVESALVLTEAIRWYSNLPKEIHDKFKEPPYSIVSGVWAGGVITSVSDENEMHNIDNVVKVPESYLANEIASAEADNVPVEVNKVSVPVIVIKKKKPTFRF